MRPVDFVKMHGAGNDFIVVDLLQKDLGVDLSKLAVRMCDRNFGVGADGLLLVMPSASADYRMRLINRDGTEAEMCGNGIRVFAKYLFDRGMVGENAQIETLAGIKRIHLEVDGKKAVGATVNMGSPKLDAKEIPVVGYKGRVISRPLEVDGSIYEITCVNMGNPHCVIFMESVEHVPVEKLGPKIEVHPTFPQRTNVEFVQILSPSELVMRVWERGAGMTLACGTGACSSVVAGVLNGKCGRCATVHLPGGDLRIEWREDNNLYMTGPAVEVYTGTYYLEGA